MLSSAQLKQIVTEARPLIERQLDLADQVAGLRDVVSAAGGDWSQLKALVKAQIQDERDDASEGKRVKKILDKADYATAYADMLGLSAFAKMNEENFFADDQTVDADQDPITPKAVEQLRQMAAPQLRAMGIDPETGEVKESTAARKDVLGLKVIPAESEPDRTLAVLEVSSPLAGDQAEPGAGTQAPPVDTHSETPVSHAPVQPGREAPGTMDGAASTGETANAQSNLRKVQIADESEAAMLPQTGRRLTVSFHAAERVAVESSATVSKQEPSVEADRDGGAGELGGEEGSQSPLPNDRAENTPDGPAVIVAAPISDRTKPNPWCVDPDDCGVEASWTHMCGACLRRRDAQRSATEATH